MGDKTVPMGYQQITTNATAAGMTLPNSQYVEGALIRVMGNNARWRSDGPAPTATSGMPINTNDTSPFWIWGMGNLVNFKVISTTSTGTLEVLYFGVKE